jgi:hypothetical protein
MAQPKKAAPDWERIEADYRAGILSLREIAAAHPGSNHVAIARKAKASGWTRDLSAKIKAKADELVTKRTVTADVTAKDPVSEREIIDSGAEAIARIRLAHRTDISRSRALAMSLLAELESVTGSIDLFQQLGEMLRSPDDKGIDKLNDLYMKVVSMSGRVSNMKQLSDTLKTLIGLEREAYGLANAPTLPPPDKSGPPADQDWLGFPISNGEQV